MIHVTVWNEFLHEQEYEGIRRIYPNGIHGAIAEFLGREEDMTIRTATLWEEECGLSEEVLKNTDVLIWWGHARHEDVPDAVARRVADAVNAGMGLIALHSAHLSKPLRLLLGTSMTLGWKENDSEVLYCTAPSHPIASGITEPIVLEHEELYGEYFDIPKPEDVIFTGWFAGGAVFRSGVTFVRGLGKIFYFQPGHEEYPIYYQPEIQQIITNAVRWCRPINKREGVLECRRLSE